MTISTTPWRKPIIEPAALNFGPDLILNTILGYPHAGNDVFYCQGAYKGQPQNFYLKLARHKDANLGNEARALSALQETAITVPQVLAYGTEPCEFLAISEMNGRRMSGPLAEPYWKEARSNIDPYLVRIANSLVRIHQLDLAWEPVRPRTQFSLPALDADNPSKVWLQIALEWLREHEPQQRNVCFVHGDHHYANLLWWDGKISAVLDWELCGMGWREFDLAWSVLPRPGQAFLHLADDQERFLETYAWQCAYDHTAFVWCFVLIASHFMSIKPLWHDREYHLSLMRLCEGYA